MNNTLRYTNKNSPIALSKQRIKVTQLHLIEKEYSYNNFTHTVVLTNPGQTSNYMYV